MENDPSGLMKIKILSWNVRWLDNREKKRMVKSVVRSQKANLVCFFRNKGVRDVVKGGEKLGCWKVYGLGYS